ncbi:bone morphogenetic protein 7-like [Tachypleus tridentatus]|uniref:bone morphogenetic protein 7-like n=1 Tax=Tachypleus tridentatus TaxID=6853 RepID=UPI003FD04A38
MAPLNLIYVVCILVGGLKPITFLLLQPLDTNNKQEAINKLFKIFDINSPGERNRHMKPPQYMLDLYKSQVSSNGDIKSSNPYKVSIVRSFSDKDRKHRFHFYFNITGTVPSTESVKKAEFHLYKMKPKQTVRRKSENMKFNLLELRVYQVMQTSNLNKENNRLLDIRNVSTHTVGWQVFHVKPAIVDWLDNPKQNLGLIITARTIPGNKTKKGIIRFAKHHNQHVNKQPILVLFNEEKTAKQSSFPDFKSYDFHGTPKHNLFPSNYHDLVPSLGHSMDSQESKDFIARTRRSTENQEYLFNETSTATNQSLGCNRFEMYVNFEQIGWSDWIIFPKGYSAFYCKGGCDFPLGQNEYPSNHATVQSIVNTLNLIDGVPKPSCVPNKLSPFLLLYQDDGGNFVLRQYSNMVAESCGCH